MRRPALRVTAGDARAILSLEDSDGMQWLADKIVNEDLSVRAAEAAAKAIAQLAELKPYTVTFDVAVDGK